MWFARYNARYFAIIDEQPTMEVYTGSFRHTAPFVRFRLYVFRRIYSGTEMLKKLDRACKLHFDVIDTSCVISKKYNNRIVFCIMTRMTRRNLV